MYRPALRRQKGQVADRRIPFYNTILRCEYVICREAVLLFVNIA